MFLYLTKTNCLAHLKLINFWIMLSSMRMILPNLYLKIKRMVSLNRKMSLNKLLCTGSLLR
uniref:Uncharacterized protein n=1 Tax=virus sp. ctBM815 TaxID=2825806 RepID=A0A8S5RKU8_9VIRU|nr:MAG TPA: hypothetical protein [virus sp. ctBM815]